MLLVSWFVKILAISQFCFFMINFIKGLFLFKDRSIAKEMVDDDQKHNSRERAKVRRFDFRKRSRRRNKYAEKKSTVIKVTVYDAFLRFINYKK